MNNKGNVMIFIYILIGIVAMGTIGYQVFLDVSFVDAFYMTIITISTVGYTEVAKMDVEAKLFSVFLIIISLGSVGSVGYLFTRIVSSLMEGDVREAIRRRIMEKKIAGFKDHYILCGVGEVGWNAIKRFQKSN